MQSIPDGATIKLDRLVYHGKQTDERLANMSDFTERLYARLEELERYRRKNLVVKDNPPFNAAKPTPDWLPKLLEFFNKLIKFETLL